MVTLEDAKNYLRIDTDADDSLIETMLNSAIQLCRDISRCEEDIFENEDISRVAVLYTLGYLYEHREDADHHDLQLTLRSLLFGLREGVNMF